MNALFSLILQFLLKSKDIPMGDNLLPLVNFLMMTAREHGFIPISEEAPSGTIACEGLGPDSPFGEISLEALSHSFVSFLNEVYEREVGLAGIPIPVEVKAIAWEITPQFLTSALDDDGK